MHWKEQRQFTLLVLDELGMIDPREADELPLLLRLRAG